MQSLLNRVVFMGSVHVKFTALPACGAEGRAWLLQGELTLSVLLGLWGTSAEGTQRQMTFSHPPRGQSQTHREESLIVVLLGFCVVRSMR